MVCMLHDTGDDVGTHRGGDTYFVLKPCPPSDKMRILSLVVLLMISEARLLGKAARNEL